MTINELVRQLQKQADAIGGDAPVVLYVQMTTALDENDEYLVVPTVEVRDLRVKGRGSPALATPRTRLHGRKGVVLVP